MASKEPMRADTRVGAKVTRAAAVWRTTASVFCSFFLCFEWCTSDLEGTFLLRLHVCSEKHQPALCARAFQGSLALIGGRAEQSATRLYRWSRVMWTLLSVNTPLTEWTPRRPDNSERRVTWTRLNWAACVCCAVGWWPIGSTEPGWSKLTYRRRLMVTLSASGRPLWSPHICGVCAVLTFTPQQC